MVEMRKLGCIMRVMNKILVYTFRTFPWVEELETISNNIVILNRLREDIALIEDALKSNNYSLVLGIAKGNQKSVFETKGVNQFNNGSIVKGGKELYPLYYPENGYKSLKTSNTYTKSFCNWGIYKTAQLLEGRKTKHMFLHILESDIELLKEYLTSLELSS